MKRFLSERKKKILARSLALGLCLLAPWHNADAVTSYTTPNGLFRLDYYGKGETLTGKEYIEAYTKEERTSLGSLAGWQKERLNFAADYWEGLLKHSTAARQPVVLAVKVDHDENAWASAPAFIMEIDGQAADVELTNLVLNHGEVLTAEDGPAGLVTIGTGIFPADARPDRYDTPLPQNSRIGLTSTMIHEIAHAMGIGTDAGWDTPHFTDPPYLLDRCLYDWRGVQAEPGMEIRTSNYAAETKTYFDLTGFTIDRKYRTAPYFSGPHVQDVLEGAKLRVYNFWGEKMNQKVPGLPVNGNEGHEGGKDSVDLSHIELRNSLLSHQDWRNYVSLMEAEMAVLQDLGYTVDRRDYFGRSVYGSGRTIVNDAPYYARNANGTAYVTGAYNRNPYGMGLHIYGSENTVYQNAPLMTQGVGAVGIRIDGYGNAVTVNRGVNVQADGLNGNGILTAYGRNHRVTLAEGSRVTADGEGGIGAAFDFGQNILGNEDASARASYAARNYHNEKLNPELLDTDGPLVTDFTVQGELRGKKAAVYISDNAFVKNIRVGTGAKLSGDIVSKWVYDDDKVTVNIDGEETADPGMQRQYDGTDELTTKLSFEGTGLTYSGSITGADNMRLAVSGNLVYGGTAQVLSATVEKGGTLLGGTYSLVTGGPWGTLLRLWAISCLIN